MLKLIEYIKNNINWKKDLSEDPFNLIIVEDNEFILFYYNQLYSDFNNEIVRECRGLILDKNLNPVCVPFFKFGNYGETYNKELDWNSTRIQEKVDGSIIKLWNYNDQWRVSTSKTIDANNARLSLEENKYPYNSIYELYMKAVEIYNLDFNILNKNYTHLFELCSPYNQVVVPHKEIKLFHIGTRDNITLEELDIDIGIPKPKKFNFNSIDDIIKSTNNLTYNDEGYVLVDKYFNRVKIKSKLYTSLHYLLSNPNTPKLESLINIIRTGEIDEVIIYFPELERLLNEIKDNIQNFITEMDNNINIAKSMIFSNRKEFSDFANEVLYPKIMYMWYDKKIESANEFINTLQANKLAGLLKKIYYKEDKIVC